MAKTASGQSPRLPILHFTWYVLQMKIRKCHAAGFSLLATNHKSCKWHAETGSNATWWSLYDINLLLHAKETEKKVDYHKMLKHYKEENRKKTKKKKDEYFEKEKNSMA